MHKEPRPQGLSLRQKFWLIIGAPLLAVITMGSYLVIESYQLIIAADQSTPIINATVLTEVTRSLQRERSSATVFAGKPTPDNRNRWRQAISATNLTLADLEGQRKELRSRVVNLAPPLATVHNIAAELPGLRDEQTTRKLSALDIFDGYSEFITELQLGLAALGTPLANTVLQHRYQALTDLSQFIETSAQLRDRATIALNNGRLSGEELQRLAVYQAIRQQQLQTLISQAPPQLRRQLVALRESAQPSPFDQMLTTLNPADTTPRLITERWLEQTDAELAAYYQLQNQVRQRLQQQAATLHSTAKRELILTLLAVFAIVFFAVIASRLMINQLVSGFQQLQNTISAFVQHGQLTLTPSPPGTDELGRLNEAFNQLIETLGTTADVVQSVAAGDFSQRLPEKGPDDRLSRSINHMTQSLCESIAQMTQENWLKAGLSELAATLNSNVLPERLAGGTLSFIATRLGAVAGAIYRCNDDGSATLLASYAGNPRLRIAPGEGLVSQVAADGQSIYCKPPRPDYLAGHSGLGEAPVEQIALLPLPYANHTLAVLELGLPSPLASGQKQFLQNAVDQIGIALHAALSHSQLAELLKETQLQTQQLEIQRNELEQSNAELEAQSQQLTESQFQLEQQAKQLRQANSQLAHSNTELQARNQQVEEQSEQLRDASRYKSEFLANMSHELRTPLNALLVLTQTMIDNDADRLDEDQLESLRIVYSSGCDLLNLINDILDMSKIEAGKLRLEHEPVALTDITEPLRQQFAPLAKQVELDYRVEVRDDAPALLYSDGQRLLQILRNLTSNAIKFTDTGHVIVTVSGDGLGGVCFAVQDTGVGIPPDQQSQVFEAFHQAAANNRRQAGTGLGLTISKTLANLLGGDITLSSQPGRGSTFSLMLPAQAISSPHTPADVISAEDPIHGLPAPEHLTSAVVAPVVQVISTDSDLAHSCALLAHQHGYQSRATETGGGGIDLARQITPCAIIVDGDLPDMSCTEITAKLSTDPKLANCQIIALTDYEQVAAIGASQITLRKPITPPALHHLFNDIAQRFSRSRQPIWVAAPAKEATIIFDLLEPFGIQPQLIESLDKLRATLGESPRGCLILDPQRHPQATTELLESFASEIATHQLRVIVFSSQALPPAQYKLLCHYSDQLIQAGPGANERLIQAVSAFFGRPPLADAILPPLQETKVLLVDDDMRNLFALGNLLRRNGAKVLLAEDGESALRQLQEHSDIALVIMDIMLPGIDGLDTIRRIRQLRHYGGLSIIALTAKAMPEDRDRCLQAGANDYMAKPVDIQRLLNAITQLTARQTKWKIP